MQQASHKLPLLSKRDFRALGLGQVAYIREITTIQQPSAQKQQAFVVTAADGTKLAVLPSLEVALAAIRQQGLEPMPLQ